MRVLLGFLVCTILIVTGCNRGPDTNTSTYPLHQDIITTEFWCGELASEDNGWIANISSAWDDEWQTHFGGYDDPDNRNGYYPAGFTPLENPFYFALPYNDYSDEGDPKTSALTDVYWANEKTWEHDESMCKNRWIKVIKGSKIAYAQWQDTGPRYDDDAGYVFGSATPKNDSDSKSGLDVSPAVRNYLGIDGLDVCDWQFVDFSDVPDGPWKNIITTRQISW